MACSPVKLTFLLCVGLTAFAMVMAADPDPLADFTVPNKATNQVKPEDFVFKGDATKNALFMKQENFTAAFVNFATLPVLRDQGISLTILNIPPGAQNSPHSHPRASEVLIVIKGVLTNGLADTTVANQGGPLFFETTLMPGEAQVFPRGLPHFQINKGKEPVIAVAGLNSANPGTVRLQEVLAAFANVLGSTDDKYYDDKYYDDKYYDDKYYDHKN